MKDRFEAVFAIDIHSLLKDIPGEVMNHRGFWRFLAIGPFASCTVWRQDGKNLATAFGLPVRRGGDEQERRSICTAVSHGGCTCVRRSAGSEYVDVIGADLWWSHLFRVQLGRSIPTAHVFLEEAGTLPVADQRRLAPLVTAARGRLGFDALDDSEVQERVRQEKARAAGRRADGSTRSATPRWRTKIGRSLAKIDEEA